jgi:hypothetical protein
LQGREGAKTLIYTFPIPTGIAMGIPAFQVQAAAKSRGIESPMPYPDAPVLLEIQLSSISYLKLGINKMYLHS